MPVYKLVDEMPYEELLGWMAYFEKRPVDWRDDDRTYKLLQVQGVKEKPWKLFSTLNPIYNATNKNTDGTLDPNNLKQSAMFTKMLLARNGDKLDL